MSWAPPRYPAAPRPAEGQRHPVVVVGGGMVGLTAALDLARHGQRVVLLDDDDTVSVGSRAICHAKRTLEIYGRLGLGPALVRQGVQWNTGRVFQGERQVYEFNLLPEDGHEYPAFINLQQYHLEAALVDACAATGLVDLRWKHRLAGVDNRADGPLLAVETPDGAYRLTADWLIAADGARSTVRQSLGLDFVGRMFRDRFLIADVKMRAPFPAERWFWFDPPFHPGGSVLLHRQADDVWRIDFQLAPDADPDSERDPARVTARVRAMLGEGVDFSLEWVSVYSFRCRRLARFRHGRTFFVGDAAHQVSPFGARGGNGGIQDVDNLCWKLDAVLRGAAPERLLDSYDAERIPAADENILHSTRATDFITPKNVAARTYRDAVLGLAAVHPFARTLVNSGRLSRPAVLLGSPLNTPDDWPGGAPVGSPAPDAPIDGEGGWLLRRTRGFTLLAFADTVPPLPDGITLLRLDPRGTAASRYGARPGSAVLLRPDQHIAARFGMIDADAIQAARDKALSRC